jgi:cell division protein FtsI (penicillin-binding protein 3)
MGRPTRRALNVRLLSVGLVVLAAWGGIGYRLVDLQLRSDPVFAEYGADQRVRREVLLADRGTIFDRDGFELALTVDGVTVVADPQQVQDPEATARLLAALTGTDVDVLRTRLTGDGSYAYVARKMDKSEAARVEQAGIPGVFFETEPLRVYPGDELASNLLGFVQIDDNSGLEGIEYHYDAVLAGTPGELLVERDRYGLVIPQGEQQITPAEPGSDLVLTIDREIEFAAERALRAGVERTGASAAMAVVYEVATGDILAMASYPTFDPGDRSGVHTDAFRNRAVTDTFEPGSTLKVVTVAAALEEGIVIPETVLPTPPEIEIDDKVYRDVGTLPAEMSVADIVAYSSNVGTIGIQALLGNELHHQYLSAFGLGQPTGIDFPGERSGTLWPLAEWYVTSGPSSAIGYRVDVTALQLAAVFATVANDGVWMQPHLVREIVDGDGAREAFEPVARTVLSPETAATMRELLAGVVERGTGSAAAVDGYRIGGKTGTTELYLEAEGVYSEDEVVASFVGMAPIDDPQLVVAVVLVSPQEMPGPDGETIDYRSGGKAAAPVFSEIMESALHQYGVPPDALEDGDGS